MNAAEILDGVVTGGRIMQVTRAHAVPDGKGGCAFASAGDLVVEVVRDGDEGTPGLGELLGYSYLTGVAIMTTLVGPEVPSPDHFEEVVVCLSTVAPARTRAQEGGEEYGLSVVRTIRQAKYSGARVIAMRYRTLSEGDRAFDALAAIWHSGPNYEICYEGQQPLVDVFGILAGPGDSDYKHFQFQSTAQREMVTPFQTFLVFRAIERAVANDDDPAVITLPRIPVGGLPAREVARG